MNEQNESNGGPDHRVRKVGYGTVEAPQAPARCFEDIGGYEAFVKWVKHPGAVVQTVADEHPHQRP